MTLRVNNLVGFGGSTYRAHGVYFDGTNDYLNYSSTMTGAADGKVGTIALWFKVDPSSNDGLGINLFSNNDNAPATVRGILLNRRATSGLLRVRGYNAANSLIMDINSASAFLAAGSSWNHAYITWDLANSSNRALYINGVDDSPTYSTYTNDSINHTTGFNWFGSNYNGANPFYGDVADYWYDDQYLDPAIYIDRFIKNGKPVFLGGNGERITGAKPLLHFSGPTVDWQNNRGSGGGFTENGALTNSATSPSD